MKWLREALDNLESDGKKMMKLLDRISSKETTVDGTSDALMELQYFVEDIDNANDLIKLRGLEILLEKLNDDVDDEIKTETLFVISAMAQNNPPVQEELFKVGGLEKTIKLLDMTKNELVAERAFGVISAILKNYLPGKKLFFHLENNKESKNYFQLLERLFNSGKHQVRGKTYHFLMNMLLEDNKELIFPIIVSSEENLNLLINTLLKELNPKNNNISPSADDSNQLLKNDSVEKALKLIAALKWNLSSSKITAPLLGDNLFKQVETWYPKLWKEMN